MPVENRQTLARSPRRLILAGLGVLCIGLAMLGVVVPGLPTTIFLLLASYLFAHSCPVLEDRLLRIRLFRPYLKYVYGDATMPLRARVVALALMWAAVSVSLAVLASRQLLGVWTAIPIVAAALTGTVMILTWRRVATDRPVDPAGVPDRHDRRGRFEPALAWHHEHTDGPGSGV